MAEHDAIVFLLSLAVLLGGARLLGELARSLGLPLVVGELVAGVLLGATGLGRIAPGAYAFLFRKARRLRCSAATRRSPSCCSSSWQGSRSISQS